MNGIRKFGFFFLFVILLFDNFLNLDAGKPKRTSASILQEYREVLPKDVFAHFSSIYRDKSLKTIEKLKLLDEMFMVLPDSMLKKLPIPSAFRQLPLEERRRIHRIYYGKTIPFREKLRRLEQFLRELPGRERELVPIRPIQEKQPELGSAERRGEMPMPTLVEFDVPVLLQFNGHMETNALKQYLPKEEFQMLKWILNRHGMDEASRARLIGVLLKKSYQSNADNFPLPLNGDSQEIADEIRRLGVRLMFGRNPFDRVDPFAQKFEMLKRIRENTEKEGTSKRTCKNGDDGTDEPCRDDQDQLAVGDSRKEKAKSATMLEAVDLFPSTENGGMAEDWRQQDEAGGNNQEKREMIEEEENGRISGNLLGKFISLFNGTIHWNPF